jgi:hypothetical protein
MYQVQKSEMRAGRETIVVVHDGRRIGSASVKFVKWMHDCVPKRQLRPEQIAMVDWYDKHAV